MGGNALSKPSVRLTKPQYDLLWSAILTCLFNTEMYKLSEGDCFQVIPSYADKETFGDMDIVVKTTPKHWNLFVTDGWKLLGGFEAHKNGSCLSVGFPYGDDDLFQVDFIYTGNNDEQFYAARNYFAYNDLGNLQGRCYNKMGFKYGHDGLSYCYRDPENPSYVVKDIHVSYDTCKIFEFLKFDWNRWGAGFNSLEDIFKYVESNEYFNPAIFLLENRNHTSRVRDAKRPTYTKFLKWIEDSPKRDYYDWSDKDEDRKKFLELAFEMFPKFKVLYDEATEQHKLDKEFKSVFNGDIVSRVTGLKEKELGKFMQHLNEELRAGENKIPNDIKFVKIGLGSENMKQWIESRFNAWKK